MTEDNFTSRSIVPEMGPGNDLDPERLHQGHFSAAFIHSVVMVIATEIGDKTFFIAAVLAMSKNMIVVFFGAWGALAFMTVLSALMGLVLPSFLAKEYVHWFVIALFAYFGGKALYDGLNLYAKHEGAGASDELIEVEEELKSNGLDATSPVEDADNDDVKAKLAYDPKNKKNILLSRKNLYIAYSIFFMVFLAEWGDKSQVATVAMGAARDFAGVILGAVTGHALCTGVACLGGRLLAEYCSERVVLVCSGVLFLGFAVHAVAVGPED